LSGVPLKKRRRRKEGTYGDEATIVSIERKNLWTDQLELKKQRRGKREGGCLGDE